MENNEAVDVEHADIEVEIEDIGAANELSPLVKNSIIPKLKAARSKERHKKNIFVIGASGTGKSTFINSMIMAINAHGYAECAYHGTPKRETNSISHTKFLRVYNVLEIIMPLTEAQNDYEELCNPCFMDIIGFSNSDDENMRAVLAACMCGLVPENTMLHELMKKTRRAIKREYPFKNPAKWDSNLYADVCIFVMSAEGEPPAQLMSAVYKVATSYNFEVPIFLVVTMIDKVSVEERGKLENNEGKVRDAMNYLGIDGERVFMVANYVPDENTKREDIKRIKSKDEVLCMIWKRILGREYFRRENKSKEDCIVL